jgi:hypothetical protein
LKNSLLPANLLGITNSIAELKALDKIGKREINHILPDVSATTIEVEQLFRAPLCMRGKRLFNPRFKYVYK